MGRSLSQLSVATGLPNWSSRPSHAHNWWKSNSWMAHAGAAVDLAPQALRQLTNRGKSGRNIIPLYGIIGSRSPRMALLSRKGLLAIAAVIEVALYHHR